MTDAFSRSLIAGFSGTSATLMNTAVRGINKKRKRSDVLIGRDLLPRPDTSRFCVSGTYPAKLLMHRH